MNKGIKKEQAITLIALVVTIVVLLILAGVSIAMLTGDNGIMAQAQDAKNKTKQAEIEEQVELAVAAATAEGKGNIDIPTLNSELDKIGYEGEDITSLPKDVTIDGVKVTIKEDGSTEIAGSETENEGSGDNNDDDDNDEPTEPINPSTVQTGGTQFTRDSGIVDIEFLMGTSYKIGEANKPKINEEQMIPVNWDGSDWVVTDQENWDYSYDTTNKKWANVMLKDTLVLEGMNNETIQTATIADMKGKKVTTEGSMLVWMPRYAYKIIYYEPIYEYVLLSETEYSKTEFESKADFENNKYSGYYPLYKENNIPSDETYWMVYTYSYDETTMKYNCKRYTWEITGQNKEKLLGYSDARGIVDSEGKTPQGMAEPVTSISVGEYYRPHPAFETDLSQGGWSCKLTGIWMAKFETTEKVNNKITMRPNQTSYAGQTIGTYYTEAQNLGISNSHIAKNSEWGAMAYLSESKYGRNGEAIGASETYKTTGDGNYKEYVEQSTTGNIYGIYDTVGNYDEYTAGYVPNNISAYGNAFASTDNTKNNKTESTKYATVYRMGEADTDEAHYLANENKMFGDAIIEVTTYGSQAWHDSQTCHFFGDDWVGTMADRGAFLSRSDDYSVFCYCGGYGEDSPYTTSRVCVIVE